MAASQAQVSLIAALDRAYAIGKGNDLPWHLPDDLKRFKALTLGKPVLMGSRTARAIGFALPGRPNLVLTRSGRAPYPGQFAVASLDEAIALVNANPNGNGTGGSSQRIKGEFSANGVQNDLKHTRGVLSMARSSAMDSASSQFFIMHADAPHLDGQYAAFGKVISGMEVVDAICEHTPVTDRNGTVAKANQPVIERIIRVEKPEE